MAAAYITYFFLNNLIKAGPRADENSQWKTKISLFSLSLLPG